MSYSVCRIPPERIKSLPVPDGVAVLYKSYYAAESKGFYSKKALKDLGLTVRDDECPNAKALVTTKYGQFAVYSIAQCNKPSPKLVKDPNPGPDQEVVPDSTTNNTHKPSSPYIPFDVQNIASDVDTKDLRPKFVLQPSRGLITECRAYFPANFETQDWAMIAGNEEEAAIIFHQIYLFRHLHGLGADDFVSFAWAYGRELLGRSKFDTLMRHLLTSGILERTETQEDNFGLGVSLPRGKARHIAYGYRFVNPDYRRNYIQIVVGSKVIAKRLKDVEDKVRYPVQRHLRKMLDELQAIMPTDGELEVIIDDTGKVEAAKEQLKAIQDGMMFFKVDAKTRRIYSNLTSLKRGAREYLRVRGEPPWQVDLPCCHLLALAHKCLEAGVQDAEEFLRYCEKDFYRQLADEGGFTREQVKEMFTRKALNAANRHRYQRSPVMRFFRKRWRHVARYMWQRKDNGTPTKENPKPHNKLALELQKWEANLVIFRICDRIRKERPKLWLGTIHDAVVCLERDVPYVVEVTRQELHAFGISLAPEKLKGKPM